MRDDVTLDDVILDNVKRVDPKPANGNRDDRKCIDPQHGARSTIGAITDPRFVLS